MNPIRLKRATFCFTSGEPGSSGLRGICADANLKQLRSNEKLKNPHSVWKRKPKTP